MKRTPLAAAAVMAAGFALSSCETSPGGSSNATTSLAGTGGDESTFLRGRALFEGRCARCHALPKIAAHSAAEWPGEVARMAKRSGLKPAQSGAVLSYILHEKKKS